MSDTNFPAAVCTDRLSKDAFKRQWRFLTALIEIAIEDLAEADRRGEDTTALIRRKRHLTIERQITKMRFVGATDAEIVSAMERSYRALAPSTDAVHCGDR